MGFFNLGPMPVTEKRKAPTKLSGCDACGLDRSGQTAAFKGNLKSGVLILGDYPAARETSSEIFTGAAYHHFWDTEGTRGLPRDWKKAAAFGYAVQCPCPDKDAGTARSLCCKARLDALIKEMSPKVIICLGPVSTQALIWDRLAGRITNIKATDFIGKCIPDRTYNCWICPTYGVDFLSWQKDDGCPEMYFRQHLRRALSLVEVPLPKIPDQVKTTTDPREAASLIDEALREAEPAPGASAPDVAIDYETTGLKPHRDGHRIVAASLAWRSKGEYKAIGFKWDPDCPELVDAWKRVLYNGPGLIAHKADFEACWSRFRSGLGSTRSPWPTNWSWDTCLAAHVIDNNQKVGLKFHTYCELGVLGYDAAADRWLSSFMPGENPDSCNAYNLLKSRVGVPWGEIAYYCGLDSLYTIYLRDRQEPMLDPDQMRAFEFFMEGMLALAKVQSNGLPIDMNKVNGLKAMMTEKFEAARKRVMDSREAAAYEKAKGMRLNPDSNKQLVTLLYDILKYSDKDGRDAREATLSKIGGEFCRAILEMRHWSKMRDTFLDGYIREAVFDEPTGQWLIRPFFNLAAGAGGDGDAGPRTYRSSADSPNFQNIPKRDKEMKKLLRSLFVAPPGFRFAEYDYKSLEVMVSASYHHDPQMIHYLQNPESDMHRDTAADMYMKRPEDITKEERSSIKSGYVFSSFYGASYRSCAVGMWNNMPQTAKDWLAKKGIRTLDQFTNHVKKADDIFWNKRFAVYNKWRRKEWQRYQDYGYVQSYTGFRCFGPMGYTEATNRCIQGSAFHILLRALIWNVADFEEMGLASVIVGQIHDALVVLEAEDESEKVRGTIYKNGVQRVSQVFPWICVPLVIEGEASEVGGTWAEMKEVGALG